MTRNCARCNSQFEVNSPRQVYCNSRCRANHFIEMRGREKDTSCIYCGRMFKRRHKQHNICSRACSSNHRESTGATRLPQKICDSCGMPFTANRKDRRYCSVSCYQRRYQLIRYYAIKNNQSVKEYLSSNPNFLLHSNAPPDIILPEVEANESTGTSEEVYEHAPS